MACLAVPSAGHAQGSNPQPFACLQLVEALSSEGRVALQGVTFDFNRATLRPDSLPALIAARDAILTLGGDWAFEGHTDNIGNRDYNQRLSETRAQAVREWLVSAGAPAERLSAQGFSFDRPVADNTTDAGRAQNRRVELVGAVTPDMLGFGGPAGSDPCPDTLTPGRMAAADGAPPPPPIPDWSGATGQEWLPFSLLMATGYGVETGWRGDRLTLPPGARPETCQALCTANSDCAAFSFEPAGSDFVETARCALIGYGTELTLRRDNNYLDGGTFYASGLKPDARLLTSDGEALAGEIIADLAEIARLRDSVRIIAPDRHAPETWMDVVVEGAVRGDAYPTYLEIALPEDSQFDWRNSRSSFFIHDTADGRSGQIWVPEPGEYVLRYVINHPTAALHTISEQSLIVLAGADVAPAETTGTTAAPSDRGGAAGAASLSFPMAVAPGEAVPVTYTGPLHSGDWIDIITAGNDEDMSGGWSWAYAEGAPVTLTAPGDEGDYTLRYVAEHPERGRIVLAQDALVVRRPVMRTADPGSLFQRCEAGAMMTCDFVLPERDLVLTLISGYGITEPVIYETAGGARAARPSFDVVRLSDGEVPVVVNARQAQTVYCQANMVGDDICLTHAFGENEGMLAGLVIGTLTSYALHTEAQAMGGDDPDLIAPGDLQGIWFFQIDMPGTPGNEDYFIVAELMQDAGNPALEGNFTTSPTLGPVQGVSGDLAGVVAGDTLNLTMAGPDGVSGLVFTGTEYGADAYRGMVYLAHSPLTPPTGAILRKRAGPGEDWDGPPWMRGEPDGMAEALQMGAQALQGLRGQLEAEDAAVLDMLGQILGTAGGALGSGAASTPAQLSPMMGALDGVPLDALSGQEALQLLAPHLEE